MARLAVDPEASSRFSQDPLKAMHDAGLPLESQAALLSGDQDRIRAALAAVPAPQALSSNFTIRVSSSRGSLTIAGTGIRSVGQMTIESITAIRRADKVMYGAIEPVSEEIVRLLNPGGAESLAGFFIEGKPRPQIYHQIADAILRDVRSGLAVCMVVYGHPGVFVDSAHEAMRRARSEGFAAVMLPGISAEDCLFADLGVDPVGGCQSYEATDFLINGRIIDPSAHLILWQIGALGNVSYRGGGYAPRGMPQLLRELSRYYQPFHPVCVYEASVFPGVAPSIRPLPLSALPNLPLSALSTLYIPPGFPPRTNPALLWETGLA